MTEFVCVFCEDKFADRELLKEHFREHGSKPETSKPAAVATTENIFTYTPPSHCEICGVECANIRFYWQHYRTVHPGWRGVDCAYCAKHFLHNSDYLRHCEVHGGEPTDKVFKCRMCTSTFFNKGALNTHLQCHKQIQHLESAVKDPSSAANRCVPKKEKTSKLFRLRASFCKACHCQFVNSTALAQHLVIHRLFLCLVCGKEMTTDKAFQSHQKEHLSKASEQQLEVVSAATEEELEAASHGKKSAKRRKK